MANKSTSVSIECEWFLSAPTAINQFTEQIFHPFHGANPSLYLNPLPERTKIKQMSPRGADLTLSLLLRCINLLVYLFMKCRAARCMARNLHNLPTCNMLHARYYMCVQANRMHSARQHTICSAHTLELRQTMVNKRARWKKNKCSIIQPFQIFQFLPQKLKHETFAEANRLIK